MNVLEYLNSGKTLEDLTNEFGIKVNQNENMPDLFCLNYCQINSPKSHPIVKECRSLVLKLKGGIWWVGSRSFDRFFNYGEIEGEDHDITKLIAYEKVDGSLVGIWYDEDYGWLYRTRSMITPEGFSINGHEISWAELIERNLPDLESLLDDQNLTYICEIVSRWNRVVTKYDEESIYLLAVRENDTGDYRHIDSAHETFKYPKWYEFNTLESCLYAAKNLPNLEEGYVLYDYEGKPVIKVKSPAYVAAHKLRGEGTPSPKRVMDIIIENEQDEYLSIFPEDYDLFNPYQEALRHGLVFCDNIFALYCGIEDQKEFALKIKDRYDAGLIFSARNKGGVPSDYFHLMTQPAKYRFIESAKIKMEEENA